MWSDTLIPTSIPSEEAFGIPLVVLVLAPTSIASEEVFGFPTISGPVWPARAGRYHRGRR